MPKAVLSGPKTYEGKGLIHVHTEQIILHTENFMAHFRGGGEIGDLRQRLFDTYQLVCGTEDFLFYSSYNSYRYCEHNEVTFLWKELSTLKIHLDIREA